MRQTKTCSSITAQTGGSSACWRAEELTGNVFWQHTANARSETCYQTIRRPQDGPDLLLFWAPPSGTSPPRWEREEASPDKLGMRLQPWEEKLRLWRNFAAVFLHLSSNCDSGSVCLFMIRGLWILVLLQVRHVQEGQNTFKDEIWVQVIDVFVLKIKDEENSQKLKSKFRNIVDWT